MASPNDRMDDAGVRKHDDMRNDRANDDRMVDRNIGRTVKSTDHQTPEHVEELHFGGSARGAYYDDAGNPRKRGFFWRFSRAARAAREETPDKATTTNAATANGAMTSDRTTADAAPIVRSESEAASEQDARTPDRRPADKAPEAPAPAQPERVEKPARPERPARFVESDTASELGTVPGASVRPPAPKAPSTPTRAPMIPTALTSSVQEGTGIALEHHGWTVARKCVAIVLTMVIVAAASCTAFWMWENRLRPITVTVNGETVNTRVNTSIATLLSHSDGFGTKAGRMLSVTGKTLDENGGERYSVTLGQHAVKSSDLAATRLTDGDALLVKDGKDVTEPHKVVKAAIPFGNDINLKGGGTIQYVEQQGVDGVKEQWVGKKSKETADKKVLKEPVNFKVTTKSPNPQDGKKYIALTFDDGPSKYTQDILNILNEKGVHATFFNLSEQGTEFPDQEKAVAAAGNEVASHSVSHKYLPKLSRDDLRKEINDSFAPIESNTGATGRMFRSPYGAFEAQQWVDATDLISMNVLWSIDTEDWRRPGPDKIHDAVLEHAKNGSIVLMHDGGGDRSQDVDALPRIIDDLKNEGFTFVTVSELIKLDGTFPKHVTDNQPVPAAANDTSASAKSSASASKSASTTAPSATKSATATTK